MSNAEPRFDIDLPYGQAGEGTVAAFLRGRHEVKRKRRADLEFYFETEANNGRRGWDYSGLNVTEAHHIDFVIADTGIIVAFPTQTVAAAITAGLGRSVSETDGSCPTHGRLIGLADFVRWAQRRSSP